MLAIINHNASYLLLSIAVFLSNDYYLCALVGLLLCVHFSCKALQAQI